MENGLRPNAAILFADSAVKQYKISERMNYYGVPSVSIAVIHNGKLAWAKAYGVANDSTQRKVDSRTLYQAASLSKTVNAFAILRLVQAGKLALDQDIRPYLKSWNFPDNELSKGKMITLSNLLSHTAGLSTGGFMGYAKGDSLPTINEMLDGKHPANSETVKPIFAPGTHYQYSGGGILVTRKILMDHIAWDYAGLMDQQVLQPLGMTSSTYAQPLPAGVNNFALGYDHNRKPMPGQYTVTPELAPDGLWTTPSDYAKLVISIQRSLSEKGGLLDKKIAETMVSPVLPGSDAALGTFILEHGGEKYFWHRGANKGYRSIYYGSCTTGDGVVVMINSDNDQILDEIVNSVAVTYNWKSFYEPEVRKLAALPAATVLTYTGEYHSEHPSLTIIVRQKDGALELSVGSGHTFEKLYFTSLTSFFLMSSPDTQASFTIEDTGKVFGLQVMQGNKILFTAKKQ